MPDWLIDAVRSGWITGIAVAILVVETGILLALRHHLRLDTGPVVFNAISGIALMTALGNALMEQRNYGLIVLCLSVAFAAHIGDVVTRIRRLP